jgi:hypothetical protein
MTYPAILIHKPRFPTRRSEVKVGDEHVLVGEGEEFGGLQGGEV